MPVHAISTQRLKLNICAYAKHPVNQIYVIAKYKGETLQTYKSFSGPKTCSFDKYPGKWVTFTFSPKERGFLDFFDVCIKNTSTSEVHCENHYWFPNYDHSTHYIEIYANR